VKIELQECENEQAALTREAELLRALKPQFNRAGTWPGTPRFLAWKATNDSIEFTVAASPQAGWNHCGSMGVSALHLCSLLARLLWLAMNRTASVEQLPEGWAAGRNAGVVLVRSIGDDPAVLHEAGARLATLLAGEVDEFCQWIEVRRSPIGPSFERAWLDAEFESLCEWFKPSLKRVRPTVS